MNTYERAVLEFHKAFACFTAKIFHEVPTEVAKLRARLIDEEEDEYQRADSRVGRLDALCDLMYVLCGAGLTCNVPCGEPIRFENSDWRMEEKPSLTEVWKVSHELTLPIPCIKRFRPVLQLAVSEVESAALFSGFNFLAAFKAVHENNMAKLWTARPSDQSLVCAPVGGKWLVKRKDGKVMKPLNHTRVNLDRYV